MPRRQQVSAIHEAEKVSVPNSSKSVSDGNETAPIRTFRRSDWPKGFKRKSRNAKAGDRALSSPNRGAEQQSVSDGHNFVPLGGLRVTTTDWEGEPEGRSAVAQASGRIPR